LCVRACVRACVCDSVLNSPQESSGSKRKNETQYISDDTMYCFSVTFFQPLNFCCMVPHTFCQSAKDKYQYNPTEAYGSAEVERVMTFLSKANKPLSGCTIESMTHGWYDAVLWLFCHPQSNVTAYWSVLISHPAEGRRMD